MSELNHSDSPLAEVAHRDSSVTSVRSADPKARPTGILVVDDEDGIRRMLDAGLSQHGFAVWQAAGGQEAIEIFQAHRSSVDLVLLDVRMPGQDGPETLAELRKLEPQLRVCFMTGDSGQHSEQSLRDMGALAIFRKPFRPGVLASQLIALTTPSDPYGDVPKGR